MALPTTDLTFNFDAADNDKLFDTINGGGAGVHTDNTADGDVPEVWDDEGSAIAEPGIWTWTTIADEMGTFRASGPIKSGLGSIEHISPRGARSHAWNQDATLAKVFSDFFAAGAKTIAGVIYPTLVDQTSASPFLNHTLIAEGGRNCGIFLTDDSGTPRLDWYNFDGSDDFVSLNISINAPWGFIARHDGSNLDLRTIDANGDTVDATPVASGNSAVMTGALFMGFAGTGSKGYYGHVGQLIGYNAKKVSTEFNDLTQFLIDKWLEAGQQKVALARF